MFTSQTLLEGKWVILVLVLLSVAGLMIRCWSATAVTLALLAFTISFFRDPEAAVPADEKLIVAPATGKIVEIKPVDDKIMVAIFLSVFDVHVQRSPIAGTIKRVQYQAGKFLDVRHPQASAQNEYRLLEIEAADGFRVTVRQIAGLIARRIVGWRGEGATLAKGERFGMIRFGSRVELFLPRETEIVAKVGERATGGETILAKRR
jgi:phosphatidylserine decarboxylase